jgi:hypothetical protein
MASHPISADVAGPSGSWITVAVEEFDSQGGAMMTTAASTTRMRMKDFIEVPFVIGCSESGNSTAVLMPFYHKARFDASV